MAKRSRLSRSEKLAKLAALPAEVRSAIKQALAQSADELTDMQKRMAPHRTGKLKESIVQTWGGGRERYSSLTGTSGTGDPDLTVRISAGNSAVRYAHLVEFGTAPHMIKGRSHPGTAAQAFFYPAYRSLRKSIKSRISRATNKAAKRVAAGK